MALNELLSADSALHGTARLGSQICFGLLGNLIYGKSSAAKAGPGQKKKKKKTPAERKKHASHILIIKAQLRMSLCVVRMGDTYYGLRLIPFTWLVPLGNWLTVQLDLA